MKKQAKTTIIIILTVCFLLVAAGKPAQADTFNGRSTGGVNLRVKDKGTGTTDTTEPTDSSSSSSSSTDGGGNSKPTISGGGSSSGGKTYFPQTGEIVRGGMGLLGAAVIGFVFFFLWKKKKKDDEEKAAQNHK